MTDTSSKRPSSSCCGGAPTGETLSPGTDVREVVREKYGAIAEGRSTSCGCGAAAPDAALARIGYGEADAASIPEGANLGLGCGNPVSLAQVEEGDAVLDLGSGAGIDCFLAARRVGPRGRVVGVDMTPAMVERARATAEREGIENVEFRLGEIESLPVADESMDVVVSNCVVNLSPDKGRVFREALRVLRPGGRLVVSDLVLLKPLDERLRRDVSLYVGCVAGALLREEYLAAILDAGFSEVEILSEGTYDVGAETLAADAPEREAFRSVSSVTVRATKPLAFEVDCAPGAG